MQFNFIAGGNELGQQMTQHQLFDKATAPFIGTHRCRIAEQKGKRPCDGLVCSLEWLRLCAVRLQISFTGSVATGKAIQSSAAGKR